MNRSYTKTVLPNGVTVLSLPLAGRAGVAVGVWMDVGSRDDPPGKDGMAHFVEHLMFKGTETRTALQIARELEHIGGSGDAYTAREETCYYAYVPAKELPLALDIIGDMIAHSRIDEDAFHREKQVVLEEMAEIDDSPQETAMELFPTLLFGDHPLGKSILGSTDGIKSTSRTDVIEFLSRYYVAEKTVVAAAGKVDHQKLCELAEKYVNLPAKPSKNGRTTPKMNNTGTLSLLKKRSAQVNVIVGGGLFAFEDERRYPFAVLNKVLGIGASSLLFNRVREEEGIGYDVHSFAEYFQDCGLWGVFGAFESKSVGKFFDIFRNIMDDLAGGLIDNAILKETVDGLCGRLLLQKDSVNSMLARLAENELQLNRFITIEESIEKLRKVTADDVRRLAEDIFNPENLTGIAVGPVNKKTCPGWLKFEEMV